MARMKMGEKGHADAVSSWHKTMIAKYGSEEAMRAKMREIAAEGGRRGCGPDYKGGFAANKALAKSSGAKGGRISRRGYTFVKETEEYLEYIDKKTTERVRFYKQCNKGK